MIALHCVWVVSLMTWDAFKAINSTVATVEGSMIRLGFFHHSEVMTCFIMSSRWSQVTHYFTKKFNLLSNLFCTCTVFYYAIKQGFTNVTNGNQSCCESCVEVYVGEKVCSCFSAVLSLKALLWFKKKQGFITFWCNRQKAWKCKTKTDF